jgi:hypothetical protein
MNTCLRKEVFLKMCLCLEKSLSRSNFSTDSGVVIPVDIFSCAHRYNKTQFSLITTNIGYADILYKGITLRSVK